MVGSFLTQDEILRLQAENKKFREQIKRLRKDVEKANNRIKFWFYFFILMFGKYRNIENKNHGFKISSLPQMSINEIWK